MNEFTLIIADDHEIVRFGIRTVLECIPDCRVVGEASEGESALALVRKLRPSLAILDVYMPLLNGYETAAAIREVSPETATLILTVSDSSQVVREVLKAGARGYLLKSDAGRELAEAVHAIRHSRTYFTDKITSMVIEQYVEDRVENQTEPSNLSPRELEIIRLLASGESNKEVATELNLSVKTVDSHRTNLMRKLRVTSLAGLLRYAIREGLIDA
jgi:DNA-binding NarL/FixJ family response regulator